MFQRGENEQTPTIISKIAFNTPASRASLHEGDIILAINNINIENHSHEEVINMIRHSRELELLIKCVDRNNSLEESLQKIRNDLSSNQLIEQYEVCLINYYFNKLILNLDASTSKRWLYI